MVIEESFIDQALARLEFNQSRKRMTAVRASLGHIRKIVEKILSNPLDAKVRRILLKNFTSKKFLVDVPGAIDVMTSMGFFISCVNEDAIELREVVAFDILQQALIKLRLKTEEIDKLLNTADLNEIRSQCIGNCGYFGNADNDGFCSLCYKKHISDKKTVVSEIQYVVAGSGNFQMKESKEVGRDFRQNQHIHDKGGWSSRSWWPAWTRTRTKLRAVFFFIQPTRRRPIQADLRKCWSCLRKIPLTAIACQCGYLFCTKHRSTLDHDCNFNFRRAHKAQLQMANPTIQGKKFDRLD